MSDEELGLLALREDIRRMLAEALATTERHNAELRRLDERHAAEMDRRDVLHTKELHRRDELRANELEQIREALETRDVIGQAKGVIMAALECPADEAFVLIRNQSRHENRKLVEVAAEIARRPSQRSRPHRAG